MASQPAAAPGLADRLAREAHARVCISSLTERREEIIAAAIRAALDEAAKVGAGLSGDDCARLCRGHIAAAIEALK